jgi:Domain of unknown function (DUF4157)
MLVSKNSHKKTPIIQPKLTINSPGDKYEQEADAMANKVMQKNSLSSSYVQNSGLIGASIQRKCVACEEEEKSKPVMRKESGKFGGLQVSNSFSSTLNTTKGAGNILPKSTRSFMENAFSTDFSGVRIHADSQANNMSQSINAKAFTHGNDIYFGAGQYAPNSDSGKSLLAHELTHTIQQEGQNSIQRMADCPSHLSDVQSIPLGWREYPGPTGVFHCGYRTILEDRVPTTDDPMNECVYDHEGTLVTDSHPYSGCQGTPNQYDSRTDALKHGTIDSGGVVRNGIPALIDSGIHAVAQPFNDAYNWLDRGIRGLYGF